MRAFVFPGQGAQVLGMGRDLAQAYPAAMAVFDEVDDALGEKLSEVIWGEDLLAIDRQACQLAQEPVANYLDPIEELRAAL